MKIVYVSNSARIPSRDANSVHLMKMCSSYASLGHQVTLFVSTNKDIDLASKDVFLNYGVENNFKIRRVPIPSHKIGSFFSVFIITPLLVFFSFPDLVHSRNLSFAWSATILFRLPVILELHDNPNKSSKSLLMFKQLIKSKKNKGFIVITKALSNCIKPIVSDFKPILIAPDGVDESIFIEKIDIYQFKNEYGIKNDGKKIAVYTGHLYPGRGIELIVELAKKLPNIYFYIVGGTNADVTYWKNESLDTSNLIFIGFQPPSIIHKFQQIADVLLMPYANQVTVTGGKGNTASYASPLKMFEYMAAGKAVFSSKLPVLEEVLEHRKNALLLDYSNINDWLLAFEELESNPSLGEVLGQNALKKVKNYTWQKRAFKILNHIKNIS